MLRRTGGNDAACGRAICVSGQSLQPRYRVSVRLVPFLVIQTGTIAAVAVAFANFTGVLVKGIAADNYIVAPHRRGGYAISLSTQQLLAIAMILIRTATNTCGLKTGKLTP